MLRSPDQLNKMLKSSETDNNRSKRAENVCIRVLMCFMWVCVCNACCFRVRRGPGFPLADKCSLSVVGGRFLSVSHQHSAQPVCLWPVIGPDELWCPVLFCNPLEPVCLQPPPLYTHAQTNKDTSSLILRVRRQHLSPSLCCVFTESSGIGRVHTKGRFHLNAEMWTSKSVIGSKSVHPLLNYYYYFIFHFCKLSSSYANWLKAISLIGQIKVNLLSG